MATKDKRFQSGREVMATYIPGYSDSEDAGDSRFNLGITSGGRVGATLLEEFAKSLKRKMPSPQDVRPKRQRSTKPNK